MVADTEAAIWERILQPETGDLLPEAARAILALDFRHADHERMAELAEKSQEGSLSESERRELERYLRVDQILTLLQSKARQSLQRCGVAV